MADKITFDDKVSLTTSALPRANKCTDDDLNEIKQVINANADELDGNTEDIEELQHLLDYSTIEKKIGTWIDNKPIYRKVITATTGSVEDTWYTIASNTNISKIINIFGYMQPDSKRAIPFSTPYQAIWFDIDGNGNLHVAVHGNSLFNKNIEVVIEYTKTTD